MAAGLGAVALAGGMNLAGDAFNAWANYNGSKKLMQRQFEYNKAMWEMNNEYNKPINQMSRLQEAGLNPHLVYGNGGASATAQMGSSTGIGNFHGANFDFNPLADLASYQSVLNLREQNEKIAAETENVKEDTNQKRLNGKAQRDLMAKQGINTEANTRRTDADTVNLNEQAFSNSFSNLMARMITGTPQDQVRATPESVGKNIREGAKKIRERMSPVGRTRPVGPATGRGRDFGYFFR